MVYLSKFLVFLMGFFKDFGFVGVTGCVPGCSCHRLRGALSELHVLSAHLYKYGIFAVLFLFLGVLPLLFIERLFVGARAATLRSGVCESHVGERVSYFILQLLSGLLGPLGRLCGRPRRLAGRRLPGKQ
eukprot:4687367-Alexandrium_andersonii.AAC.1